MKKKFFTAIMIILTGILLCGCTANVGYGITYTPNEDGTYGITQSVVVSIDKASIISAGKTTQDFNNTFKNICNDYISYLKNSFTYLCTIEQDEESENGFSQKIRNLGGEGATVQKLYSYVNEHMKPAQFEKDEDEQYFLVAFYQNFDTILAYRCFWGILDTSSDGSDVEDGEIIDKTFYQKTVYTQNTVFHDFTQQKYVNLDTKTQSIIATMENFFDNQYNLDNQNLKYTFSFATPQSHFYTDADLTYQDEYGNTVNVWNFSSNDLKSEDGDQIVMYTIAFRTTRWYQLAIYLTVILGVLLLLISTIIGTNKPQQTKK